MQRKHEDQKMEKKRDGKKSEEVFMLVSTFILTPHTHTNQKTQAKYTKHKLGAQPLVAW